ncbi:MAG: ROK family transcriptional regulator [Acetivibrionales bacterium]
MKTIGNASLLKDLNKSVILNAVKDNEPISRADIVNITKLALPTVLRNVNNLIDEGFIIEIGKGDASYGRKPILLKINPSFGFFFGVKVGRKMVVICTDFKGNMVDRIIEFTDIREGPLGIVKQIKRIVYQIMSNRDISIDKVLGVGIATPGFAFKTSSLISRSFFAGWEKADFEQLLQDNLPDLPTVHDYVTICGAIGEHWFGRGKDSKNYVYIYVDAGVGGGVVTDGRIYRGKDGYAGHIGHHVVNFEGDECYCGNRGCLETYVSTVAIVKKVQQRLAEGDDSILISRTQGDPEKVSFNMIVDAYRDGDVMAREILAEAGRIMGIGVANSINMYNPDTVILGGEVCCTCPVFVEEAVKVAISHVFALEAAEVDIVVSDIEQYPEAFGAVALAMSEIYKMPEI